MNFTAIDFETANAKRVSACSIGMAKVRDGEIVDTFYELIRPEPLDFNYINMAVHGITPEMVKDKPTFLELYPSIEKFIDGDVLVAHNASFEQSVINQIFSSAGLNIPDFDYLCTLYMTKVNYPRRFGYKLSDVYKDLFGRSVNHHHALDDAMACAEIGVHNIGKFPPQSLQALISVLYVTPIRKKEEWKKLTGLKPSREELDENHPYFDKKFVLTGVLSSLSREKAVQALVDCGGVYQEGITKATDYLLVGDEEFQLAQYGKESNKMQKAKQYNTIGSSISIIKEKDFIETVIA